MDEYELELLEKLDREIERTYMARDEQDRRLMEDEQAAEQENELRYMRREGGV